MEAVLLSTPLSHLRAKENAGEKSAKLFISLKRNIDKPLSAILSLNTVAHTVGAAGVGAQAIQVFGEAYFGVVSAVLTLLILVFTEIIPKTIGARYSRELVPVSAYSIKFMIFLTYPLVKLSAYVTNMISKNEKERITSREEISALANIGAEEGVFGAMENEIMQNCIRLRKIRVAEIKTPRVVVNMADEEMGFKEFLEKKDELRHSRIPVYAGSVEQVTGYIFREAVFEKLAEGDGELKLKDIKLDIIVIHDSASLLGTWEELLDKKEQIALVLDEYGGMDGIVTMEDIIETLLGFEIIDEKDTVTDMQKYALEKWKLRQKNRFR